ncbi:carbohydrate ABC transporter permease [Streptomyces coeruleorubidus]|uniref:carbohydrate ABC transporter permease n=1 Tax=Streptomyces coeruleorubidus TaxID=116188 RepID=UPI00367BB105
MADTAIPPDTAPHAPGTAVRRPGRPPAPERPRRRAPSRATAGTGRLAALLVSPTLLVLTVVVLYPTLMALDESLYGPKGLDPKTGFISSTEPFVGLKNYTDIFTQAGDRFWNAFWNTTFFTVVTVSLETVIGVAMALIMHRAFKGRALVRAGILVPWAIPTAISGLLWKWIFNADGIANVLLGHQVLWTADGFSAKIAVVIADVWKTAPFIGLLVLAGLQVIPREVYEAARLDGASGLQQFWRITLPLVKPALMVAVLFRCLDALRMFDLPYILIGAQKGSVETLSMLAQNEASNVRFGPASAYAVLLFLYVFLIALAFVRLLGADFIGGADGTKKHKGHVVRTSRRHVREVTA